MNAQPLRAIRRSALIQCFDGQWQGLSKIIDEVAGKGYRWITLAAGFDEADGFAPLAAHAHRLGLGVYAFTGYMKYQYRYLVEHLDQRMIMAQDKLDQDGLPATLWGCPFNARFKARYFRLLRQLAATPGVKGIWVNDEAQLGSGCYCPTCQAQYQRDFAGPMPRHVAPQAQLWQDPIWRGYLHWKMRRWNAVHAQMRRTVKQVNPRVEVLFQASPHSDLVQNPWQSAIDLAAMAKGLDGLSTDPYYTFHATTPFQPAEVYLSEWCRFLTGIVPPGGAVEIVPQGFSHPTFTRPLGPADGYWSALVPVACGAQAVTPFTYTLQRLLPVLKTYERALAWDPYFARTTPLAYAGVVHSAQSEIYVHPTPSGPGANYDGTRVLPVTAALRRHGVPYGYLPETRLSEWEKGPRYRALVLPEVAALSEGQGRGLRRFIKGGGHCLILGTLGAADELGTPRAQPLLQKWWGVEVLSSSRRTRQVVLAQPDGQPHPALAGVFCGVVDESIAQSYMNGTMAPLAALCFCVEARLPASAQVLAWFADEKGQPTDEPAAAILANAAPGGQVLWLAGFPSHSLTHPRYQTAVLNLAQALPAALVQWAAGPPSLRVEGFPPRVPMVQARPLDRRAICSFEFFPCLGQDLALALITSYFQEKARFDLVLDLPTGKKLRSARELISGRKLAIRRQGQSVRATITMGFDTPARLCLFELA